MKLKFYFYYFIFHNTFLMRGHPISMMRKLSPRCSELSEVTQVARDCARLRTPVCRAPVSWAFSVFTCLQGHISRGQNERLGATFSQVFPSVFFFFFSSWKRNPLHFGVMGLDCWSLPRLQEVDEKVSELGTLVSFHQGGHSQD